MSFHKFLPWRHADRTETDRLESNRIESNRICFTNYVLKRQTYFSEHKILVYIYHILYAELSQVDLPANFYSIVVIKLQPISLDWISLLARAVISYQF